MKERSVSVQGKLHKPIFSMYDTLRCTCAKYMSVSFFFYTYALTPPLPSNPIISQREFNIHSWIIGIFITIMYTDWNRLSHEHMLHMMGMHFRTNNQIIV